MHEDDAAVRPYCDADELVYSRAAAVLVAKDLVPLPSALML